MRKAGPANATTLFPVAARSSAVSPDIREGWRALADLSPDTNPFFAPTILQSALATLAPSSVAILAPFSEAGRLAALAPVTKVRLGRIIPAIGVWTHLYGPLGTPLIDPVDPEAAVLRLVRAMDGARPGGRILVFPDLPLDGIVAGALRRHAEADGRPIRIIGRHRRAVLHPGSIESVRSSLPTKTRKELGRQLRRLGDLGAVTFATATSRPDLSAALDAFLALERGGWKGARGTALAMKGEALAFARAVATAAEPGEMRIDTLAVDGRPVGMLISFRRGGTMVTWKIAHDEGFARFSPGVQVMLAASEAFAEDPTVKVVDSLASADHPMIDRLWPERQTIGTLTIGPVGGGNGFALGVLLAETELKARTQLRALIRRS